MGRCYKTHTFSHKPHPSLKAPRIGPSPPLNPTPSHVEPRVLVHAHRDARPVEHVAAVGRRHARAEKVVRLGRPRGVPFSSLCCVLREC